MVNDANDMIEHLEPAMQTLISSAFFACQLINHTLNSLSHLLCQSTFPLSLVHLRRRYQGPRNSLFPRITLLIRYQVRSEKAVWNGLIGQISDGKACDVPYSNV